MKQLLVDPQIYYLWTIIRKLIIPLFLSHLNLYLIIKSHFLSNFGGIIDFNLINLIYQYKLQQLYYNTLCTILQINSQFNTIIDQLRIDVWDNKLFEVYTDQVNKYSRSFSDTETPTNICKDPLKSDSFTDIQITIMHNLPTLQVILKGQGFRWGISDFELAIDECAPGCDSCSQTQCFNLKLVPITLTWTTMDMFTTLIGCFEYRYQWTYGTYMEIQINLDTHIKITSRMRFLITDADNPTLTVKIDDQSIFIYNTIQSIQILIDVQLQHSNYLNAYRNKKQISLQFGQDLFVIKFKFQIQLQLILCTQIQQSNFVLILLCHNFKWQMVLLFLGQQILNYLSQLQKNKLTQIHKDYLLKVVNQTFLSLLKAVLFVFEESVCIVKKDGNIQNKIRDVHQYVEILNSSRMKNVMMAIQFLMMVVINVNIIAHYYVRTAQKVNVQNVSNPNIQSMDYVYLYVIKQKFILFNNTQDVLIRLIIFKQMDIIIKAISDENIFFFQIEFHNIMVYSKLQLYNILYLIKIIQNSFQINFWIVILYNMEFLDLITINVELAIYHCVKINPGIIVLNAKMGFNQQRCISVCNDGQIVDFEVCDDGNVIQFDGCYKCQLSCQLECSNCVNTKCLQCIEGWNLIDNQCIPNCGDGITVQTEQCDDGNQEAGDGCYNCQAECPYCEICNYNNKCQVCQEHFRSVQMKCLPICGDYYIEPGLEECDDGNQIQYDGCYNCQLECDTRCMKCYYGQCKDVCKFDELETDGKCVKIINEVKGILNIDDCPKGCQKCVSGECLYCQKNYVLLRGVCYQIECGNGILEPFEDCDDGNIINNDGCSNDCKIENNWNCFSKDTQINKCFSNTYVSLDYLNQTKYYQYVQLQFSKKVILGENSGIDNFPAKDSFQILGLQSDEYLINCNPIMQISQNEFRNIQYEFQIYFYHQINNKLIFSIYLNETILDENEMYLSPSNVSIELKIPKILTRFQLTASKTLKTVGHGMMISLSCSGFLMLLLGRFSQILSLLDILQQQQFLKYLNVEYPQNVYVYFESSNFITLQPLLSFFNFLDLYQNIFQLQFQQSIGKFQEYQINADFLTNIDSFIFQIVIGCMFCLALYSYEKYISKHLSLMKIFSFIRRFKSKFIESICIYFYKFKKKNLEIKRIVSKEFFIQFIYANSQDLMFKVGLFLISNTKSEFRQRVSILICFVYLGNIIFIFFYDFGKNKGLIQLKQVMQIKNEKLILFKQFSFHFILTQIQFYPILQSLLISLVNTSYITLILGLKLKTKKIELLTILSYEIPITIFILLNISYYDIFQTYLTLNQQISIGFVQIGLLISSLIGPLIECRKFRQKSSNKEKQNKITNDIFIVAF